MANTDSDCSMRIHANRNDRPCDGGSRKTAPANHGGGDISIQICAAISMCGGIDCGALSVGTPNVAAAFIPGPASPRICNESCDWGIQMSNGPNPTNNHGSKNGYCSDSVRRYGK